MPISRNHLQSFKTIVDVSLLLVVSIDSEDRTLAVQTQNHLGRMGKLVSKHNARANPTILARREKPSSLSIGRPEQILKSIGG
jgi:hypothetical protein